MLWMQVSLHSICVYVTLRAWQLDAGGIPKASVAHAPQAWEWMRECVPPSDMQQPVFGKKIQSNAKQHRKRAVACTASGAFTCSCEMQS